MPKKSVLDFAGMKKKGEKITYLTAYDFPMASFCEKSGIDMILVGDSAGMVVHGLSGTVPMTMDQMIMHSQIVRRGAPNTFIIGDMPFLSYQVSREGAIENAGRFFKEAEVAMEVIKDALAIEKAGAFALLVEAIPPEVGKVITDMLKIPVLGIGAGMYTDGQVLIIGDMLGYFEAFTPKFVKKYANLAEVIDKAFREYIDDVRTGKFPEEKHCYRMIEGESDKLEGMLKNLPPQ